MRARRGLSSRARRTGGLLSAWVALAAVVTLSTMNIAIRSPGSRTIALDLRFGDGRLAHTGTPKFAPVRPEILEGVFGPVGGNRASVTTDPASNSERSAPPGGGGGSEPEPEGGIAGLPIRTPSDSTLTLTMSADRRTVRPGESIVYTIVVRNTGGRDFQGDFTIESHIPFGTRWAGDPAPCTGSSENCTIQRFPFPGLPVEDLHLVQWGYTASRIRSGGEIVSAFRVNVGEWVPAGRDIVNDTHLTVGTPNPRPRIDSDSITVVVQ